MLSRLVNWLLGRKIVQPLRINRGVRERLTSYSSLRDRIDRIYSLDTKALRLFSVVLQTNLGPRMGPFAKKCSTISDGPLSVLWVWTFQSYEVDEELVVFGHHLRDDEGYEFPFYPYGGPVLLNPGDALRITHTTSEEIVQSKRPIVEVTRRYLYYTRPETIAPSMWERCSRL